MGFLQTPGPARKLAQQYGIKGLFSPEIVPSLQPVVLIDDLTGGIQNTPQRIATAFGSLAGVAAETSVMRFEVPPGTICQITNVFLNTQLASGVAIGFGTTIAAPATLVAGVYTDGRLRAAGQAPAGLIGFDTFAVAPTNVSLRLSGRQGSLVTWESVNWIVGRTDGQFDFIDIFPTVVDNDIFFGIQWTEFEAMEVR